MKPELLSNKDAAITTRDEENVRARAYELYEVRGENKWPCGRRLASGRRRSGRKQRTKSCPSLNLKDHRKDYW